MNDPFVLNKSTALADRISREQPGDEQGQIAWVYRVLFARMPTPAEVEIATAMIHDSGWQKFCQVLLCTNEFAYVD
jgi:hypothetical protein